MTHYLKKTYLLRQAIGLITTTSRLLLKGGCEKFFLINMFIDHHTVKSHLLIHLYNLCNTNTIYEWIYGQNDWIFLHLLF